MESSLVTYRTRLVINSAVEDGCSCFAWLYTDNVTAFTLLVPSSDLARGGWDFIAVDLSYIRLRIRLKLGSDILVGCNPGVSLCTGNSTNNNPESSTFIRRHELTRSRISPGNLTYLGKASRFESNSIRDCATRIGTSLKLMARHRSSVIDMGKLPSLALTCMGGISLTITSTRSFAAVPGTGCYIMRGEREHDLGVPNIRLKPSKISDIIGWTVLATSDGTIFDSHTCTYLHT